MPESFKDLVSKLQLDATGSLTLNGLQMVLMPRHFFRYIMREVHKAVTPEVFRKIYWQAGYDGAVSFCESFQKNHGCSAQQAVVGYLEEMSIRGWGGFFYPGAEPARGHDGGSSHQFGFDSRVIDSIGQLGVGGRHAGRDGVPAESAPRSLHPGRRGARPGNSRPRWRAGCLSHLRKPTIAEG